MVFESGAAHDHEQFCRRNDEWVCAMTVPAGVIAIGRRIRHAVVVMSMVAGLAGCAGMAEPTAESAVIAQGHYDHYDCKQIETEFHVVQARELELRRLMERSAKGAGGDFVNVIAYRSDYLRARASLKLLGETAANKHCNTQSQWTSRRSIW
jgi:hypothetical protein